MDRLQILLEFHWEHSESRGVLKPPRDLAWPSNETPLLSFFQNSKNPSENFPERSSSSSFKWNLLCPGLRNCKETGQFAGPTCRLDLDLLLHKVQAVSIFRNIRHDQLGIWAQSIGSELLSLSFPPLLERVDCLQKAFRFERQNQRRFWRNTQPILGSKRHFRVLESNEWDSKGNHPRELQHRHMENQNGRAQPGEVERNQVRGVPDDWRLLPLWGRVEREGVLCFCHLWLWPIVPRREKRNRGNQRELTSAVSQAKGQKPQCILWAHFIQLSLEYSQCGAETNLPFDIPRNSWLQTPPFSFPFEPQTLQHPHQSPVHLKSCSLHHPRVVSIRSPFDSRTETKEIWRTPQKRLENRSGSHFQADSSRRKASKTPKNTPKNSVFSYFFHFLHFLMNFFTSLHFLLERMLYCSILLSGLIVCFELVDVWSGWLWLSKELEDKIDMADSIEKCKMAKELLQMGQELIPFLESKSKCQVKTPKIFIGDHCFYFAKEAFKIKEQNEMSSSFLTRRFPFLKEPRNERLLKQTGKSNVLESILKKKKHLKLVSL